MQTQNKLGKLKERIFVTRALKGSITALGIFILGFIIAPALLAEANATRALGEIDWESVSLTLDPDVEATQSGESDIDDEGHGDVDFGTITPSHSSDGNQGTMKVKKKVIGVETSGKYFTIYLSTTSSSNGLNLVTTVNGQPSTNSAYNIPAIASEWSDPTGFGNYASWGFAVPNTPIATEEEVDGHVVRHPAFPVPSLVDEQIFPSTPGTDAHQTYNDTLWAPVATTADPQQIWKAETTKAKGFGYDTTDVDVDTNNTLDVYYGLMVNTDVLAGTYENNIVYTALASTTSLDRVSTNIHYDKEFGGKGDEVKIRFDLKDSTDSVTRSMVSVAMIPHYIMAETYNASTGNFDVTNLTFTDYNQCVVTSLTHPAGEDAHKYIDLTCNMPAGEEGSQYDFWINVNGYNYNYVSKKVVGEGNNATLAAAFTYAGLQTQWPHSVTLPNGSTYTDPRYDSTQTGADKNLVVTKMQDMTNGICNLTNAWGNTTGVDSRIYDAKMSRQIVADIYKTVDIIDEETGEPTGETEQVIDGEATSQASAALGIGTFELNDIRDSKKYNVRRLADGNCWMVQNLSLELSNFVGKNETNGGLTRENTDINTLDKTYWDPGESMYLLAKSIDPTVTTTQTSYFPIASLNRLGVSQDEQFHSSTGNQWNTYYYDDEETGEKTLGNTPQNNMYAEMPRAYEPNSTCGNYYSFNAVTAESRLYKDGAGYAKDSICPFAWRLPRTYMDLKSIYSHTPQTAAELPISFQQCGRFQDGNTYALSQVRLVTDRARNSSGMNHLYITSPNTYTEGTNMAKSTGLSVRCVAHGTENQVTPPEDVVQSTCAANNICYDANGGSGNTMANTGSATFGSSKVLSAPTYTRTGYAFVGWSESKDAVQSGAYIYGPNETITVPNLSSEGMTLYAQWLAPENDTFTMQKFANDQTTRAHGDTPVTCSTMADGNNGTTEERIALRDERDDNVYIVTRLKDGNCWMTSNLALNLADFAGKTPEDNVPLLTTENTDLSASREDLITITDNGVGDGQEENDTVKYWDPVSGDDPFLTPQWQWGATTSNRNKMYYNFNAAVAGGDNGEVGEQPDSICPAGWGLPERNQHYDLFRAYVSNYVEGVRPDMAEALVTNAPMVFSFSGRYSASGWPYGINTDYIAWSKYAYNSSEGRAANYGLIRTGDGAQSYHKAGSPASFRHPVRCVKD